MGDRRSVELHDLLKFKTVGDCRIAPDGEKAACVVRSIDEAKNRYTSQIWIAERAGGMRPFTGLGHRDASPAWRPDGRELAFTSNRDEPGDQIYLIDPSGGEARKLTSFPEGGIAEIIWSPKGDQVAVVFSETPSFLTKSAGKEREESGKSFPPRRHTRVFFRLDGAGYFDGAYGQVFLVNAVSGEHRQLTQVENHLHSLCFSPCGERLAFAMLHGDEWDLDLNNEDIFAIDLPDGEPTLIAGPPGPKTGLAYSPDGTWIAFVGHTDPLKSWGQLNDRVLVLPSGGAIEARDLTGKTDQEVGYSTLSDLHDSGGGQMLAWSADSLALYYPVSERGDTRLCRVGLNAGRPAKITPVKMEMSAFSIASGEKSFVAILGDATRPGNLHFGDPQREHLTTSTMEPRTGPNAEVMAEVEFQMPESFEAKASDGGKVHGWVLNPPDRKPETLYPCVLYVHGGPAAQYGGEQAVFHELQWLAANGYVVVFCNPRGSKGYGEAHTSAISGDWGNLDWLDIQAAADYGASLAHVDAARTAIMGGSYGGYMTAWALGHTNRFTCGIADRLVGNLHSMAGTCDFAWQHGTFFKGNAWDDPSDLLRVSPQTFAGNIQTPLLIIHSDGDLRCPVSQAEELFTALRLQRKVVEFVRYPASSSHGLSRNGPPDLRIHRLQTNLEWLDRWLKPPG